MGDAYDYPGRVSNILSDQTYQSQYPGSNEPGLFKNRTGKGMSEFVVVFIHALKNSLIPVITYLGPLTASILTGGFVAESVFSVPGLGRYFVSSISSRDYTMIMGVTIFYSALIVIMNLICDILYKIVDPRIQLD